MKGREEKKKFRAGMVILEKGIFLGRVGASAKCLSVLKSI